MPRALRSTAKRLAQTLLGQEDVQGFVRLKRLWLSKQIYRRPIAVAELRQQLIDLLRDLLGPNGTLAMPAFPIDRDPAKVFLVDRVPVYTGLLCEAFRRYPGVRRSIHLSSSVCAIGPNAEYLIRDHHLTAMPWGKDSPFCRLMEVDARLLGLGAGFNFMTPLHAVECLLYDEVPFFRKVFDGTIRYRWKRDNGETGEHEFMKRTGDIRPGRLRRYFGPDICADARISNLRILAADAKPFIEHAVALGRRGITVYIEPTPNKALFVPAKGPVR